MKIAVFATGAAFVLRAQQPEGYDPVQLLCSPGGKEEKWCSDWLACIKEKSTPEGKSKVMEAWDPAPCEEICGKWPVTTPPGLLQSWGKTKGGCMDSCENFKTSLASCVGTVIFEPGQMATMGGGSAEPERPMSENCKAANATCLPDLPARYQECVSHKADLKLGRKLKPDRMEARANCDQVIEDFDECRNCPQLQGTFAQEFTGFIGGCMDQLHAYHQATMPAQEEAAIPGAKGCKVHG
jgi:hypothetical protein